MVSVSMDQTSRVVPDLFQIPAQERVLAILSRLITRPPKVLLLEGGTAEEREKLGLYWTALLNCTKHFEGLPATPAPSASNYPEFTQTSFKPLISVHGAVSEGRSGQRPCELCPACRRIRDGVFLDLIYLDGRVGRIGIDTIRELRGLLGQAPRDAVRRVVVLGEAQELTDEAANALLKSMEDTETRNAYVLLAPQRERLLPTLVSRSWVATLSWDLEGRIGVPEPPNAEWSEALAVFLRSGRGWFARTLVKGQVDRSLAFQVIHACRHGLISASQNRQDSALALIFHEKGHPRVWRAIDLRLDDAEQALRTQVAPPLVLDWLAVGLRQILAR